MLQHVHRLPWGSTTCRRVGQSATCILIAGFALCGARPGFPGRRERWVVADKYSFDVVSQVDFNEIQNAVAQAQKEMQQRYDFKGSKSSIELNQGDKQFVVVGDDDFKLKSAIDILQGRLVKRGVSLKALKYEKVEPAAGGTVRQHIKIQSGIDKDHCKDIVKDIKASKLKVQAQIQDEQVRVSGTKKDELQEVMALLKSRDYPFHIDFTNYR
jgi:uncharacterized protein YajQ (UPF0234 family)